MALFYHYLMLAVFLSVTPVTALAMEQSFAQNNMKAAIRLAPDSPSAGSKVTFALKLEKDGQVVTDRKVALQVYEKGTNRQVLSREVDVLEDEYLDSWSFDTPGEYKIAVTIADVGKSAEVLSYEINAMVGEAKSSEHEEHGFFSHHFGSGKWRWWGGGMMLLMMVPMMIIAL
ncbi:hypothetical protein Geob_2550 [Geotalea daltonii FRC-32]|uniref:YtkA-like domain-containing protein n=1 Tax=Geotalea daltonii (strain DSM 22248 / JCM 15807 / FRC-32) TaxID=316067 RepID=B9M0P8_GEODF|nr:hypothetical protein [Geotalea daltonii]ACM20901.1 hypothetical protein Geob_2550 [Geotalea daltonii FRC-32]